MKHGSSIPASARSYALVLAALLLPLACLAQTNHVIPVLRLEDRALTNARVIKATATTLTIMHSGGGETVRRTELPQELRDLFPPTTKTEIKEDKADIARTHELHRERRTQVFTDLVIRERRTDAAVEAARKELRKLNEVIAVQFPAARLSRFGSPERQALADSLKRRVALVQQIQALEASLDQTRNRVADSR